MLEVICLLTICLLFGAAFVYVIGCRNLKGGRG